MCLLVLQTEKTKMKKASFYEAFKTNRDGVGILIRRPNRKIDVFKFKSVDKAWEFYDNIKDNEYDIISIHFRFATSGGVDYDMMHPFSLGVKNQGWLLHNGVLLDADVPKLKDLSDTASLAEYIKYADLTEKQLFSYPIRYFLSSICGTYNKFLVITPNKWLIYNEKAGHWDNGLWYSNYGYKTYNTSGRMVEEDEDIYENWLRSNNI